MSARLITILFILLSLTCCHAQTTTVTDEPGAGPSIQQDTIPFGARALIASFPGIVTEYRGNAIYFHDGSTVVYDDGEQKDFVQMLDNPDVEDMFAWKYSKDSIPAYLSDPGRGRCEALYKKIYGATAQEVYSHLVGVEWFGQRIKVTSVNGVNVQLEKVAAELATHPELTKYLSGASTYYWREVRGAHRLSAHSYGIAVDINTSYSDYWLWAFGKVPETQKIGYKNRIPLEIVEIFEKHGFIWGGRWYHFDTMHFEYRPELLFK